MRTLKELYQVVLIELLKDHQVDVGICGNIVTLSYFKKINSNEYKLLMDDFLSRKPNLFHKEYYNRYFNTFNLSYSDFQDEFWWALNEKGFQRRVLFLEKIIDSL